MGLFNSLRKKPATPAEPAGEELDLDQSIAAIAAVRSEAAIRENARDFPRRFGPEVIPELRQRFDVLVEPPPSFSSRDPSLTSWIIYWQLALYEILFQYRDHAIPALREMAFAERRSAAALQLCRLAVEGIDRERTLADVRGLMPDLSLFDRTEIAAQLRWRARLDPGYATLIEELQEVEAFCEGLVEAERCE